MASAKSVSFNLNFFLQLALGVLLILIGIQGLNTYNSALNKAGRAISNFFGGGSDVLSLIIAIVDIVAGAILIAELFLSSQIPFLGTLTFIVVIYWAVRTFYLVFIKNINYSKGIEFLPDFFGWIVLLVTNLVYVLALFIVSKRSS